jgi:calcium-dependent protein kinase
MVAHTESEHGIFNSILRGQIDFTSDPWPRISSGAKDLVRKMLNSDPKQRISAYDVLSKMFAQFNLFP